MNRSSISCGAQQHTPVISAFERLKQEDPEFKNSLGYITRSCQKIIRKGEKKREREEGRGERRRKETLFLNGNMFWGFFSLTRNYWLFLKVK
jgi:hypothetical protein